MNKRKPKTILIIYPHWHPANLAGVHRPRLTGNFLTEFGWTPKVLTVEERYFEEKPDPDFVKTFSGDFEVIRVKAFKVSKPRIVGDIGLRAFWQLYKGALKIIQKEKIDFIWIPIPSFYCALLGRLIHSKTKMPYGIDYIDPWVRDISSRKDWRHRLSNLLARVLEPIAVKKASLITGVSYEYYKPVLERNFRMRKVLPVKEQPLQQFSSSAVQQHQRCDDQPIHRSTDLPIHRSTDPPIYHTAFPYGFDPDDHKIKLDNIEFPWSEEIKIKPWIYAGAFLPNSRMFVKLLFESISEIRKDGKWDEGIRLYFVGTGQYPGKSIREYAADAGVADIITENRNRVPYLHVLNFLSAADTVMVIGSTEKHYTASKVYQALLSERPVWAIFHEESSAVKVMEECGADQFLVKYREGVSEFEIKTSIKNSLTRCYNSKGWNPNLKVLDTYSARESAKMLADGMDKVLTMSSRR